MKNTWFLGIRMKKHTYSFVLYHHQGIGQESVTIKQADKGVAI